MPSNVFSVTNLYQYPSFSVLFSVSPTNPGTRLATHSLSRTSHLWAGPRKGVTHRWTTSPPTREKTEKPSQPYMTVAGIPSLHLHGFSQIPPFIL